MPSLCQTKLIDRIVCKVCIIYGLHEEITCYNKSFPLSRQVWQTTIEETLLHEEITTIIASGAIEA